jgi:uncharacterized protein (DUF1697 family)
MLAPMSDYAAFLRGMNLGGRRITNKDLGAAVSDLGFERVETFRASGNVIFAAEGGTEAAVAGRLETGLSESLGYDVPVFLRSAGEVRAIATFESFSAAEVNAAKGKLQVAMLRKRPSAKGRREALAHSTDEDRLAMDGRELYWLPNGGISDSDLDLDALAAALGPMTVRTMGTIEQVAAKYFA